MPAALGRMARLFKIGAVVGFAVGILRALRRRRAPEVTGSATWQPLTDTPAPAPRDGPVKFTPAGVEPVDGVCPPGYPIKAKSSSKIFHVPGGSSYDRTVPDRCYANESDAAADGYRKARR